jgi:hypothetical protein
MLEKQSPPVLKLVGVDAVAVYYLQRLIPGKVISTVMKRVVTP